MKELLSKGDDLETKTVVETFGNGIRAEQAVPAAIFSFLHKGRVSFDTSINYAISLGGDTDTIASMAGAITGAYWGLDNIPDLWKSKCEGVEEAIEFANKIFELHEQRRETGSNKRAELHEDWGSCRLLNSWFWMIDVYALFWLSMHCQEDGLSEHSYLL